MFFSKFEGGKGVATAAGVLLRPLGGPGWHVVLLVWLVTAVVFRYSSLASLGCGGGRAHRADRRLGLWSLEHRRDRDEPAVDLA